MTFIDTHTHLYLTEFKNDIDQVIKDAIESGVTKLLLPNIDSSTTEAMLNLSKKYASFVCKIGKKGKQFIDIIQYLYSFIL